MKQYKIAIIGAGPGGINAYVQALNKKLNACLIEANSEMGGQPSILFPAKAIHDYPEFKEIYGCDITTYFINKIPDKSHIYLNTTVTKITRVNDIWEIVTNKGLFQAKYVVIATGGGFFKFNLISGLQTPHIHYYVKDINLYKDKKVVIAGGGDSAIDWALEILKRKLTTDISIVHRRNEFRATGEKIDVVRNSCIKLYLNKASLVLEDHKLEITDNESKAKEILDFDYLLVQYGQTYSLQDNAISSMFKLDNLNRILVDGVGNTNQENIYAIGNASSCDNKPRLIYVAVEDAKKAIDDIVRKIQYE